MKGKRHAPEQIVRKLREAGRLQRLQLLARRDPRCGYRRIHPILCREGWACNRKRVQGLWRGGGCGPSGAGVGAADSWSPVCRGAERSLGDRLRLRPYR